MAVAALALVGVMYAGPSWADRESSGGDWLCHFDKNNVLTGEEVWVNNCPDGSCGAHLANHTDRDPQRSGGVAIPNDYICAGATGTGDECPAVGPDC